MTRLSVGVKWALVLAAALLLGVGASGCGGSGDAAPNRGASSTEDETVLDFGHAADASQTRAVGASVESYYAAAAAEQSERACGLLYFTFAETLAETYGRAPWPRYLNGATTCQVVLARVFKHFHAQLQMRPTVTLVRVKGNRARALLAWKTLPAAYVETMLEGDTWKLNEVLATALS